MGSVLHLLMLAITAEAQTRNDWYTTLLLHRSSVLMSQFYGLLQQGNLSKAAVLQQAQIALI